MISVCIYCGKNKSKALEECGACLRTPESHVDVVHSIILSFHELEPHLNFISIEEIEALRKMILDGHELKIEPTVFSEAEEAYSAVHSMASPQVVKHFSKLTRPIMTIILLIVVATILFGM